MLRDSQAAHLAVAAGLPVDGYFLEEDLSVSMLRSLLARLEEREFPMPAPMAEFLLGQLRASASPIAVKLTSREQAVLQLIVDGATNKTIADELGITVHGVKHHVANLLKATGLLQPHRGGLDCHAKRPRLGRADGFAMSLDIEPKGRGATLPYLRWEAPMRGVRSR